jgi:hypothetical protein
MLEIWDCNAMPVASNTICIPEQRHGHSVSIVFFLYKSSERFYDAKHFYTEVRVE